MFIQNLIIFLNALAFMVNVNNTTDIIEKMKHHTDKKKSFIVKRCNLDARKKEREAFMSFLDVDCQFYKNRACKFDSVMSSILTV